MTLSATERSFATTAIVSVAVGVGVLGAGVAVWESRSVNRQAANSGDTPVILVGGTLTFKAGDTNYAWQTDSATEYHVSPNYAVTSIALKSKAPADPPPSGYDGDPTSDLIRLDVSSATSWQIDEYVIPTGQPEITSVKVASLAPKDNTTEIHLKVLDLKDPAGFLCPVPGNPAKITYGQTQLCPDAKNFTFSRVNITVSANGQTQESGSLTCLGLNPTKGTCRIIFRGP